jgi:hypothetical protein
MGAMLTLLGTGASAALGAAALLASAGCSVCSSFAETAGIDSVLRGSDGCGTASV